ncbi:hypothetical protein OGATHE_000847 [Ogataea polymorpha]|uniref:Uncharacterized protein n=1 Tax=Ogataea polymorpha TaxID=460523 RepID=A0A9P8TF80_9ASCO|nr:hypothetical protein OGATHE_000847 [Ogataea polymorpha]
MPFGASPIFRSSSTQFETSIATCVDWSQNIGSNGVISSLSARTSNAPVDTIGYQRAGDIPPVEPELFAGVSRHEKVKHNLGGVVAQLRNHCVESVIRQRQQRWSAINLPFNQWVTIIGWTAHFVDNIVILHIQANVERSRQPWR